MSEWWTYRLSDFLMFSPTAYWRLVERYNREAWPLHLLMAGAGLILLWLAASRGATAGRIVMIVLAAVWLWVGWAFHVRAYSQINWAANYLAAAFAIQAVLMLVSVALPARNSIAAVDSRLRSMGLALAAVGLLLYPLISFVAGRPWPQAETFGLVPEPTALVTLGLLLAMRPALHRLLIVIPTLSLLAGWTTLWLLST
jgi:hypothetical protein